jgi:uncharacterized protein (DUF697 family)
MIAMRTSLRSLFFRSAKSEAEFNAQKEKLLGSAPVPMIWLFGKTGSGKTSIVRCLTGAEDAEIGNGFRPETKFSREYDFPTAENPVLRFLDTRGLGEATYDPKEDMESFREKAHLMIVVVRAMDHALGEVVEPLRAIRKESPRRPVLLALTCLHEAYPGDQHPSPDPYADNTPTPTTITEDLRRSIQLQQERFAGLFDAVAPIDLTKLEEGFDEPEFGADRLKAAILTLLPDAYGQAFAGFEEAKDSLRSMNEKRALPEIFAHATLAATAAAVPVPWVDMPAVLGIQANLIRRLAAMYGQEMSARLMLDIAGGAGPRMLLRFFIREPLKLIPFVGMAANAALAFGYTFGLGKACCWYFGELRRGNTPDRKEVETVWKESIDVARSLWTRHAEGT